MKATSSVSDAVAVPAAVSVAVAVAVAVAVVIASRIVCFQAAPGATAFRNYCVNGTGQGGEIAHTYSDTHKPYNNKA
jgi:hypothetical protein